VTRRTLLAATIATAACKQAPPRGLLPEILGQWRRTRLQELKSFTTAGVIPPASIRRLQTATYEGPGRLDVSLYTLASSASALDAVQRWPPAAETVFFYRDEFFVVIQYHQADRKAVNEFVRDLDRQFTPPN